MTRELAVLIMVLLGAVILCAMMWGWRRRQRRDAPFAAPTVVPEHATLIARFDGLYVATTRHGEPLERIAVTPLAYRSRATIDVTDLGVTLALPGAAAVFVPTDRIVGAGRATWTIDRVVERDGLVFLAWHVDETTVVDSALRLQGDAPEAFLGAVARLLPASEMTGENV